MQQQDDGITIDYEVTLEDRVGFSLYHAEHSPTVKSALLRYRVLVPILWMLIALGPIFIRGWRASSIVMLTLFSIVSLMWIMVYPKYWRWKVTRQMRKMLCEGQLESRKAVRLSVSPDGLLVDGEDSESKLKWSAVQNVVRTESHVYIYVGPANALPISRTAFPNEAARDHFLETVRNYRELAAGLIAIDTL